MHCFQCAHKKFMPPQVHNEKFVLDAVPCSGGALVVAIPSWHPIRKERCRKTMTIPEHGFGFE
jgi:hypothetical protein